MNGNLPLKISLLFLSSFSVISCSSITKTDFYYNEFVIRNSSSDVIRDVVIRVEKTNGIFKCSIIVPNGSCSNKFKKKRYQANRVSISWSTSEKLTHFQQVQIPVPKRFSENKLIKGVLELKQNAELNAYLEQKY